jgi:hypothetical protein
VRPPAITAAAEGASEPIAVDASRDNCPWTAQSGAAWLVLQDVGGVGDGKVTLRVEANTASTPRTGTVTVATQIVSVSQAAAPVVVDEEVRLEGPASQVSGTCPTITFLVEGRLIRTNTATNFGGNHCERVAAGRNVDVRGKPQPDGSLLATRVRVSGGGAQEEGGIDALR